MSLSVSLAVLSRENWLMSEGSVLSCPFVFAADDAQPNARVPERALHLRVGVAPALPLHALGSLHTCVSSSWVNGHVLLNVSFLMNLSTDLNTSQLFRIFK